MEEMDYAVHLASLWVSVNRSFGGFPLYLNIRVGSCSNREGRFTDSGFSILGWPHPWRLGLSFYCSLSALHPSPWGIQAKGLGVDDQARSKHLFQALRAPQFGADCPYCCRKPSEDSGHLRTVSGVRKLHSHGPTIEIGFLALC